jgi:phytoene dehydrogenase-like protein
VREAADAQRIERLARELGRAVPPGTRMYLTGGATAVLEGWRQSTVDVDVRFEPDADAALERIRDLKEELAINVELASPLDFLPPLPGWEERSRFRLREGNLEVFDFDPYSQAMSKLQRGFELDLQDVRSMVDSKQVEPAKLRQLFDAIEPELYRFPAVDPQGLQTAVEQLN